MSIRADVVDDHVEALIIKRLSTLKPKPTGNAVSEHALAVQVIEAKIIELGQDYDLGLISRKEWFTLRGPLENRLKAATARMVEDAQADVLGPLTRVENISAVWAAMTLDEKRTVTAALLESVLVRPSMRGVNKVDPNRLDVAWRKALRR